MDKFKCIAGSGGLKHAEYFWGECIGGTKAQLQALGIACDRLFPGEIAGPKKQITALDPRGFKTRIRPGNFYSDNPDGLFEAWISFPGRGRKEPDVCDFAPGVTKRISAGWGEIFTGSAEALVAARLVMPGHFPGLPGMRKVTVRILPDGTLLNGALTAKHPDSSKPGAKSISRSGRSKYEVLIVVSDEVRQRRTDAIRQEEDRHKDEMRLLPRPISIFSLARQTENGIENRLRLVWSANSN